jgi:superfamily II DNA or RNA helicase
MSDQIFVKKKNDAYALCIAEPSIEREMHEYFTFYVPGYKFMPAFRNKLWDGKLRLYNMQTKEIYYGLIPYIAAFAKERDYSFIVDDSIEPADEFPASDALEFIDTLAVPFEVRDYQIKAFIYAIRNRRALLLSPTASGKSLIIYLITRYLNKKTLIIVPTISLVAQLYKDFKDYGFDSDSNVHQIMGGASKETNKQIVISTWQSIYKMPQEWFEEYDLVIGDEAHLFKAKSLVSILTNLPDCKYRFGLTGTLDGAQTHKLVLEGLFGSVKKVTSTKELIDDGRLAKFKIKALVLKYTEQSSKACKGFTYQEELDYIVTKHSRNQFIKNLTVSLNGNTLLLYQFVDKHGKILYNMIKDAIAEDRPIFFVHGDVDVDEREEVRRITENESNAIIVASYGTFSTGINIRNLHNIIFSSPSKSKIRTLQSIGRGLRLGDNKEEAILFDISDDMTYKSSKNYTLDHFMERMKIYNDEKFDYKIYTINLKD